MGIVKYLAYKGKVSIVCLDSKELMNHVKKIHNLTTTTTVALGRFLTISALMAHTEIKENSDKLTLQLNGGGPAGSLVSVVKLNDKKAILKGYIQNSSIDLPIKNNQKVDVGGAIGNSGYLNFIKNNVYTNFGYKGLSPLVSGEINEDFANYYKTSSQKNTYLDADVLVQDDKILACGGYIINLMPDANEEDLNKIEVALNRAPNIVELLNQNKSLDDISRILTGDDEIELIDNELSVVYECDCSREKTIEALIAIGKKDLQTILDEDKKASIVCHYCNKTYDFTKEDLEQIIKELN